MGAVEDETGIGELRTEPRALCGEDEFAELVAEMVADEAPRLFAVVQERGVREDGRIAAWGLAFDGHADVVCPGGTVLSVGSPDRACRLLVRGSDITARLVWVTPPTPR